MKKQLTSFTTLLAVMFSVPTVEALEVDREVAPRVTIGGRLIATPSSVSRDGFAGQQDFDNSEIDISDSSFLMRFDKRTYDGGVAGALIGFSKPDKDTDLPEDIVAKYNAGLMGKQLNLDEHTVLEDIGKDDPDFIIKRRRREQYEETQHMLDLEKKKKEFQREEALEDGKVQIQLTLMQQQAMAGAQGGGPQPAGGGGGNASLAEAMRNPEKQRAAARNRGRTTQNLRGQNNNPARNKVQLADRASPGTSSPAISNQRNQSR